MDGSPAPICILVHGTFAANAAWIDADSDLSRALADETGAETRAFRWSGANNPRSRRVAGLALRQEIVRARDERPDRPLYLIGHSHGGNVIRHAVDASVSTSVAGCFFLGTPFTNYHPRNLRAFRKVMRACFVVVGALLLLRLFIMLATAGEAEDFARQLKDSTGWLARLIPTLLMLPAIFAAAILATSLGGARRKQRSLRRRAFSESAPRRHDYVLYAPRDEAKRLLTTVDWLSGLLFALLRALQSTIVTALRHNKWAFRIFLGLIPVCLLFGFFGGPLAPYPVYGLVAALIAMSALAWTMIVATLIIPVVLVVGWSVGVALRSSVLAYGWEGLATFALFDVVASRTPMPRESSTLTLVECAFPAGGRGLDHSRFYGSADVGAFVASRIRGAEAAIPALRIVAPEARTRSRLPRFWSLYVVPAYAFGIVVVAVAVAAVFSLVSLATSFPA